MNNKAAFSIPRNKNGGVYMLYNISNHRVYIGETHNFRERAQQHSCNLKGNKHSNKELQQDYNSGNEFVFVVLEDMGKLCSDKDLTIREEQYIAAFLDKYVKLYNHETRESIREKLYFDIVTPSVWDIQKELAKLFHSPIPSLRNCRADTIKSKLENINT